MILKSDEKQDPFRDDLDINAVRTGSYYDLSVEHRPTRIKVEEKKVKWCKLNRARERLIEELRGKVNGRVQ
jgi:hypothetical protein